MRPFPLQRVIGIVCLRCEGSTFRDLICSPALSGFRARSEPDEEFENVRHLWRSLSIRLLQRANRRRESIPSGHCHRTID